MPPDIAPGDVVIEAFGCRLPEAYVQAMAQRHTPPLWLNLEYLSAEEWVSGCHALPSPHPRLPLQKYFFFPGFVAGTGGLLRERGLAAQRERWQRNAAALATFWHGYGLSMPTDGELRLSLFCYENPALPALLRAWSEDDWPVTCLVPEGPAASIAAQHCGAEHVRPGDSYARGKLQVHVLPFTDQGSYDRLLWACDLNLVRGEDSFVRAQWAARPLLWHIYPQATDAHHDKLNAFLDRYTASMPPTAASLVRELHSWWNGLLPVSEAARLWPEFRRQAHVLGQHAQAWAHELEGLPELATELVKFAQVPVK